MSLPFTSKYVCLWLFRSWKPTTKLTTYSPSSANCRSLILRLQSFSWLLNMYSKWLVGEGRSDMRKNIKSSATLWTLYHLMERTVNPGRLLYLQLKITDVPFRAHWCSKMSSLKTPLNKIQQQRSFTQFYIHHKKKKSEMKVPLPEIISIVVNISLSIVWNHGSTEKKIIWRMKWYYITLLWR